MRCSEIMAALEQLAPAAYACDWDNPGLLAGRKEKEVKKVMIALDATDEVVDLAIEQKVDFLLTHHPLIFRPLKKVNDEDFISRRILRLIQADISYVAMHTNFDCAPGCMADLAADLLDIQNGVPLEVMGEQDGVNFGIGKAGVLESGMSLKRLAELVKTTFGLPFVTVYGMAEQTEPVTRIAVSPGSGQSMIKYALAAGSQVLVTGDIGHHEGIDAVANGLAIIDAGHYGLEHIFIEFMAGYLKKQVSDELEITQAPVHFPAEVI